MYFSVNHQVCEEANVPREVIEKYLKHEIISQAPCEFSKGRYDLTSRTTTCSMGLNILPEAAVIALLEDKFLGLFNSPAEAKAKYRYLNITFLYLKDLK